MSKLKKNVSVDKSVQVFNLLAFRDTVLQGIA